jgi:hypothetical protein
VQSPWLPRGAGAELRVTGALALMLNVPQTLLQIVRSDGPAAVRIAVVVQVMRTHTWTCARAHIMYATHAESRVHARVCEHTHTQTHAHAHARTHAHAGRKHTLTFRPQAYTHTHTHTHTQRERERDRGRERERELARGRESQREREERERRERERERESTRI